MQICRISNMLRSSVKAAAKFLLVGCAAQPLEGCVFSPFVAAHADTEEQLWQLANCNRHGWMACKLSTVTRVVTRVCPHAHSRRSTPTSRKTGLSRIGALLTGSKEASSPYSALLFKTSFIALYSLVLSVRSSFTSEVPCESSCRLSSTASPLGNS